MSYRRLEVFIVWREDKDKDIGPVCSSFLNGVVVFKRARQPMTLAFHMFWTSERKSMKLRMFDFLVLKICFSQTLK